MKLEGTPRIGWPDLKVDISERTFKEGDVVWKYVFDMNDGSVSVRKCQMIGGFRDMYDEYFENGELVRRNQYLGNSSDIPGVSVHGPKGIVYMRSKNENEARKYVIGYLRKRMKKAELAVEEAKKRLEIHEKLMNLAKCEPVDPDSSEHDTL